MQEGQITMLELRFIRENIGLVKDNITHRGIINSKIDAFIDIDQKRREQLSEVESLRNKRSSR
jgi:seryl-tRNA synthetase